jgi:hypothetical protein
VNCWNCGVPIDPTVAFCTACGVAHSPDEEEFDASDEAREERIVLKKAVDWARSKLVAVIFLLALTIVIRFVFYSPGTADYHPGYKLPYSMVEVLKIDPPQLVETQTLSFPFPTYDPGDPMASLHLQRRLQRLKKEAADRDKKLREEQEKDKSK